MQTSAIWFELSCDVVVVIIFTRIEKYKRKSGSSLYFTFLFCKNASYKQQICCFFFLLLNRKRILKSQMKDTKSFSNLEEYGCWSFFHLLFFAWSFYEFLWVLNEGGFLENLKICHSGGGMEMNKFQSFFWRKRNLSFYNNKKTTENKSKTQVKSLWDP